MISFCGKSPMFIIARFARKPAKYHAPMPAIAAVFAPGPYLGRIAA